MKNTKCRVFDRDARRLVRLACVLSLAVAGCKAPTLDTFLEAYARSDFKEAEKALDAVIAAKNDIEPSGVGNALDKERIPPAEGDNSLLLLEKAMVRMAQGDLDSAIDLMRAARDQLDVNQDPSVEDIAKRIVTSSGEFFGADYERILVRCGLAFCDLVHKQEDAFSYAQQIGKEQEELIGSEFGKELGYKPREKYQRVGIGAYMEGVIREEEAPDEAKLAYARARDYANDVDLIKNAVARAEGRRFASAGNGVLHVFYLGGRGPRLKAAVEPTTQAAMTIAEIILAAVRILNPGVAIALAADPVRVPAVDVQEASVPALELAVGDKSVKTEKILDVNEVARQQLEVNLPWMIAQAVVRRAAVAAGVSAAASAIDSSGVGPSLGGLVVTAAGTGLEDVDTRNWTSLPAQIHAARIELPEGDHKLTFGAGASYDFRIRAGRSSYAVILRPRAAGAGHRAFFDQYSRPDSNPSAGEP